MSKDRFDVSVIVPCFNEEGNIPILVKKIQECFTNHSINGEIILVNDASRDGTQEQIDMVRERYKNIRSFTHEVNKGIYQSWLTGANSASGRYIVIIDADMQYDPSDIYSLYSEMQKNESDIIQCWRMNYYDSRLRRILNLGFSKFLNIIFNCRLKDIKSGFLICKKGVFIDMLSYKLKYKFPQHYITISAISKGYTIKQIPTTFNKRFSGRSFISNPFVFSLGAMLELPKAFYEFRILRNRKGNN
ncbi:MAG: glycosyltransferase family 2 protein [Candidatus Nitrosotenuis sp.]